AEGMSILRHANVGEQQRAIDAETTPLRNPELYRYDLNLRDIAEVWRRGSVIASWLLDLTATALTKDPALTSFAGKVSDSGEGRWTIKAAIDAAVPVPVLSTALYERFSSRGEATFGRFNVWSRNTNNRSDRRRGKPAQIGLRHVISISHALLGRMGRDHGVAGSIEQDALQGSVVLGPRRDVMGSLLGQSPLHGLKQLAVDQWRLRARADLTFIENLADVEAIAQEVE